MRKLVLTILSSGFIFSSVVAQTLFTYGGKPVSKEEFLKVYQKNALNKKADFSEAALRDYLNLYSLFKMKVAEADVQRLDTVSSIDRELSSYRKQLAKTYLTDEKMNEELIHEAYDRLKEEVHVAHILLLTNPTLPPSDTLEIYNRADSIYKAIVNKKADFAELAKTYSEDKATAGKGGDLGFMTALQVVYPFENAAYSTPVGKVSKPFKTQFGYHILKVLDRRPANGEVQVSQILIASPQSRGAVGISGAHQKADSLLKAIKKGADFATLAKKFSDDKFSADKGGLMNPFGVLEMTPEFEKAAFSLKKPGDLSEPVETDYGVHIIRLEKKMPIEPLDSIYATLKRKVENDSRSQVAKDVYFENVKDKAGFKEYTKNYDELVTRVLKIPDTGAKANAFTKDDFSGMNKPIFSLGGKEYSQKDLMAYAESVTRGRFLGKKEAMLADIYKMYQKSVVTDYQEKQLEVENEDFHNLMAEYKNGIMLFELMEQNIWGKAAKDSAGLEAFYEKNKEHYKWEPGFEGSVYHFKDEEAKNAGLKLIGKKDVTDEEILKKLNTEDKPDAVSIQHGHFEFSHFSEVPKADVVKGKASKAIKNTDGSFVVVFAKDIYNQPTIKKLEDARGYAIAEYQDYLEKEWNESLRKKYPVKVEEKVFMSMVQ